MATPGRKKGQTADNPAKFGVFTLRDLDRNFWLQVKMLALKRDESVSGMIIGLLEKELKKTKLL